MLDTVWQRLLSCGAEEEADMEKSDVGEEEIVEEEVEPTQVKDYDVNRVGLII